MAKEFGYVYILTNPSMPGLVKVGKTTITPNKRMGELHSTGVPTPFQLECSISVNDCHEAELLAHQALNSFRVAKNREFFKVSPKKAIEKILESVEECEVVDFRESHGIEKIEIEIQRKRTEKLEEEERKKLQIEQSKRFEEAKNKIEQEKIFQRIQVLKLQLKSLGIKPKKEEPSGWMLVGFCYFPLPIGWLFWLGAFSAFDPKRSDIGYICIGLLVVGFFAHQASSKIDKRNEECHKPFDEIEQKILNLEIELTANSNVKNTYYSTQNQSIKNQSRHGKGNDWITCPTCRNRVEKSESQIDFKCHKCGNAFRY